ncbi:MAG TPA: ferredoxin [Planctomycetaceae bacterium]|nr:ferredoxin [Planctomycetaceae bacterium]
MTVVVTSETCTGCGECVSSCPLDAISLKEDGKAYIDPNTCGECGACVDVCPVSAIVLS